MALVVSWRMVLPLIIVFALIVYEDWVSTPSCWIVSDGGADVDDSGGGSDPEDLKVMMVANLLLLGSEEAGFVNLYFRDYYLTKFFKKAFESLNPDMLLVLGDVSAKGPESMSEWLSVLHQFHQILGPFRELPYHVTLGDKDVGQCSELKAKTVSWITRSLPGLDGAGCGAFEISNVSFVSLNAVALLCGNNDLLFSVEKVIEKESIDLQMETELRTEAINESKKFREISGQFQWRENAMSSGSGPVLLLHFPLYRTSNNNCRWDNTFKRTSNHLPENSNTIEGRRHAGSGPYDLLHTLPLNATKYIFQALRPRIVFSAHSHQFCDYTHSDGMREITVPAMSWNARDDPGFVIATFKRNISAVSVSYCTLARESSVLIVYLSILVLLISILLALNIPCLKSLR